MTLGPVMLDIAAYELTAEDREILKNPVVGGVILFSRNYHSLEQLEALVKDIHELRTPHLLIAVDQEGGRVQRFKDGFSLLPELRQIGHLYEQNIDLSLKLAKECAWLMGSEIRSTGIDMSFAPVLDLDTGLSQVIGSRAFHSKPEVVSTLAKHYVQGMVEAGMQATGKHFPGHGSVSADSHIDLPIDQRSYEEIRKKDLYPFTYMIKQGIHALMVAHIIFSQVDDTVTGFSTFWLAQILRKELNFQGAIFSDDLSMAGAKFFSQSPEDGERVELTCVDSAKKALHAGCDMILVCNNRDSASQVVESLQGYSNPASSMRLALLHGTKQISREQLVQMPRWKNAKKLIKQYVQEPSLDLDL
ncbi:MAG: beta-N-acetylhexosaminidase [Gammaproteobacteria bacterium]|nr:beta-N-acetylhexosaminidase [Gammaproteobacteria bacterium]